MEKGAWHTAGHDLIVHDYDIIFGMNWKKGCGFFDDTMGIIMMASDWLISNDMHMKKHSDWLIDNDMHMKKHSDWLTYMALWGQ